MVQQISLKESVETRFHRYFQYHIQPICTYKCFFDFEEIGDFPNTILYPIIDLLVEGHLS